MGIGEKELNRCRHSGTRGLWPGEVLFPYGIKKITNESGGSGRRMGKELDGEWLFARFWGPLPLFCSC